MPLAGMLKITPQNQTVNTPLLLYVLVPSVLLLFWPKVLVFDDLDPLVIFWHINTNTRKYENI